MIQMEQFLPKLPRLKHLELILTGDEDLIDGYRWEILTYFFTTFNFKFNINSYFPRLDSFRTSFWLKEKRWYVRWQNKCLFLVPHFFSVHVDIDEWTYHSSEINFREIDTICFKSMNIKGIPPTELPFYTHIKKLSINCSISFEKISSIVDLKKVQHLSILSITDLLIFQPFESTIPNLYELTIENAITFHGIEQFKGFQFKQIRNLNVATSDQYRKFILQGLFYCFPHIQYLKYSSRRGSIKIIKNIIDEFVHLLNASFYFSGQPNEKISNLYSNSNYIIQNSRRLNEKNFTCRIQQISSSAFYVHYWIAPQVSLYYMILKKLFLYISIL
jgi:hypothetical protein